MSDKKEYIVNIIKLVLLIFMMVNGFFMSYAFIWFAVGLPQTNWAIGILYALACISEYGYYRWLAED